MSDRLAFVVLGEPVSRQRPGANARRRFREERTESWYGAIRDSWHAAGAVELQAPIALAATAYYRRGTSHFTTRGELSAVGRRAIPGGVRDVDSATVSAVMDALNGCAWADDRLIVEIHGFQDWAAPNEPAYLMVEAWTLLSRRAYSANGSVLADARPLR